MIPQNLLCHENFLLAQLNFCYFNNEQEEPLASSLCKHGTIIRAGKTCKKISCYMRDSARRWFIAKTAKYFAVMLNSFEFS